MVNQELIDYIKKQIKEGHNKEEVKKALLGVGWQEADIEEVFKITNSLEPAISQQPVLPKVEELISSEIEDEEKIKKNDFQSPHIYTKPENISIEISKKSPIGLIITIILTLLIIGAGIFGYFYFFKKPLVLEQNNQEETEQEVKSTNEIIDVSDEIANNGIFKTTIQAGESAKLIFDKGINSRGYEYSFSGTFTNYNEGLVELVVEIGEILFRDLEYEINDNLLTKEYREFILQRLSQVKQRIISKGFRFSVNSENINMGDIINVSFFYDSLFIHYPLEESLKGPYPNASISGECLINEAECPFSWKPFYKYDDECGKDNIICIQGSIGNNLSVNYLEEVVRSEQKEMIEAKEKGEKYFYFYEKNKKIDLDRVDLLQPLQKEEYNIIVEDIMSFLQKDDLSKYIIFVMSEEVI